MALHSPSSLGAALLLTLASCTTAKKREEGERGLFGLPNPLILAKPVSAETVASLRAIADDPSSMLPPNEPESGEIEAAAAPTARSEDRIAGSPSKSKRGESWRSPGINPDEVNPGDIFSENEGPVLRKAFSVLDEMEPRSRSGLLNRFAESESALVPMTFTTAEIAALRDERPDLDLPTRSVALDFRTETHTLDEPRFAGLLAALAKGESGGSIESPDQVARLRKQLESVKRRLSSGERLQLVTAVTESKSIHASYPGAPAGRRDAERLANTVSSFFPHLVNLASEKDHDGHRLSKDPRIVWEFDTRDLALEGGEIRIVEKSAATR